MIGCILLTPLLLSSLAAAAPAATSAAPIYPSPSALSSAPGGAIQLDPTPIYNATTDFDYQSLQLGLHQEYIELDLFHYALTKFSDEEWDAEGIDAADRFLIQHMADQEVGHATVISNILGASAAKPCTYQYPFNTVREFVDFCQKLTRWGEAGVYGFLEHLQNRASANLVLQSITQEARQQMSFRQFEGLFPYPEWFTTGITQSMQWTLLAPYITSCPAENPHLNWTNLPALNITNDPTQTILSLNNTADISTNVSSVTAPGYEVHLVWDAPGKSVGPNASYATKTLAGAPQYAAWIAQLNVTYTELYNVLGNSAYTVQPNGTVFGPGSAAIVNGTQFILITDSNPYITPANMSYLDPHVVAGPAMYQAD
ncbi:Rds1 protein [Heliocybe sulcata]|uniref:Rds1 protein n=1 Tax=Heliocybe sulcata TaxID=5364 RepID=A0A5C3MM13_9AGAM|nr:Rds1 protein [Heliocybe sulcata]